MIDPTDLQLIVAVQEGLPIISRPYAHIAEQLAIDETEVIERLSRELRNAVPNSIRVQSWAGGRAQCLQFTPIVASTVYTDIPVSPETPSKSLSVIPLQIHTNIEGSRIR